MEGARQSLRIETIRTSFTVKAYAIGPLRIRYLAVSSPHAGRQGANDCVTPSREVAPRDGPRRRKRDCNASSHTVTVWKWQQAPCIGYARDMSLTLLAGVPLLAGLPPDGLAHLAAGGQ